MNSIARLLVPLSLGLATLAPAQGVVEARAPKATSEVTARAEKAWKAQDWNAAADAYAKVVELDPENGTAWHHYGYALHALGRLDEALAAHERCAKFPGIGAVGAYNAACVNALQGHTDAAFDWLVKSKQMGFADRAQIEGDTDLTSLRDDPRFAKYLESLGSAKAPKAEAYVATTARQSARLLFWGNGGSPGQLVVDYGQPVWKDEYAAAIASDDVVGKRWRLGQDFWTTFDTNVDLRVGDADVPAGAYYLTLAKTADGAFVLAFNDPAVIRKQKLDAYLAGKTTGGIEVELMHAEQEEVAKSLEIGLVSKKGDLTHGALTIRFGPHALKVPFEVRFGS